ncbi:MAG: alpha-L-fucosidase [Rikenellaceae bacterium]
MKIVNLLSALSLAACTLSAVSCSQSPKPQAPPKQVYAEDWDDLNRYPQAEWLNELKFGMYYHWNYSTLALSPDGWYGRNMYNPNNKRTFAQHMDNYGGPDKFGYKDFEPLFTAEGFSAKEWVDNLERVGGKFMVGMAVHHDGFDLYDSSYTEWNSVDKEPHIDIMGELEREARKKGMKFGLTTHLAWNWLFFSEFMYPDKYDAKDAPELYNIHDPKGGASPEFVDEWYNRTVEMIDNYKPDFLWFDFGTKYDEFANNHTRKLTAHYYNRAEEWGKTVSMASKFGFGNDKSKVHDLEQSAFGYIHYPLWMSDCTMNQGWFYNGMKAVDDKNATGKYWLHQLIDIVSKNGTLLLNLGPKPDGSWPEDYTEELFKMGDWLHKNEEAIYYTKPWHRFGEGPTFAVDGSHYRLSPVLTSKDIRFTTKDGVLYATVCGWSDEDILIKSLGLNDIGKDAKIKKITLLDSSAEIEWTQKADALKISTPQGVSKDALAYCFKIEGEGLCPERANEYANIYLPTMVSGVKSVKFMIPGEGSIALAEVTIFDGTASRRALRDGEFTDYTKLAKGTIDLISDRNFNGHPLMESYIKTKSSKNPSLTYTFKNKHDLKYITIFPAMDGGAEFMERGVVEFYDAEGKLIESINVKQTK